MRYSGNPSIQRRPCERLLPIKSKSPISAKADAGHNHKAFLFFVGACFAIDGRSFSCLRLALFLLRRWLGALLFSFQGPFLTRVIEEFDNRERGTIAGTSTQLDYSGIATRPIFETLTQLVKKATHSRNARSARRARRATPA